MNLKQHILKMKNYNAGLKYYFVQHCEVNAKEEEVVQEEEVVVACDICGKRYKVNGLNTHKAVHKKNNK